MSTTPPGSPVRVGGDRCPGALRLHEAADGYLARIRVPGGLLTSDQVIALADAASTLGDGQLSLTARGNLEIRGLDAADGDRLSRLLDSAGLLPSATHERIRNIVASPAAGLDGSGVSGSLVDAVRALDRLLCDTARAADLSGRFLFGLDDGRGDVLALQPDVAAQWVSTDHVEVSLGRTPVLVLPAEAMPAALTVAAVAFLNARDAVRETAWRITELVNPTATVAAIVGALRASFPQARPVTGSPVSAPVETHPVTPAPGPLGADAVALPLLLGTAPATTWLTLASIAASADGLVRTTPGRSVVIAGLTADARRELLDQAGELGLITHAGDPALGVSACTGLPGCASSARDVRGDVLDALATVVRDGHTRAPARLPVHVSGCERRCGHPRSPHREAVAIPAEHPDARPYATTPADGDSAAGAPLGDGHDVLVDLIGARPAEHPRHLDRPDSPELPQGTQP